MDYTWTVSTPTSSSAKLLMSVVAVRHRFLVAVFVVALFFCPCWCKISSLSLTAGKKKLFNVHVVSRRLSLCFTRWFVSWTLKLKNGWMVVSSLTLHSGQSYPGTREQPGSRTGTHPGGETETSLYVGIYIFVSLILFDLFQIK